MFRKISRGCLLALWACPVVALAEPMYSLSFLPVGFNATAMNNAGHIVGNTGRAQASGTAAPIDLGPGANSYAYAINSRGDLVSAVPEPGSHALLTAGLVLLAGWRRSGRRESLRFFQPA